MLCREIMAVCSQIHTKHINTLCGQNVEFVSVLVRGPGAQRSHWAVKGFGEKTPRSLCTTRFSAHVWRLVKLVLIGAQKKKIAHT